MQLYARNLTPPNAVAGALDYHLSHLSHNCFFIAVSHLNISHDAALAHSDAFVIFVLIPIPRLLTVEEHICRSIMVSDHGARWVPPSSGWRFPTERFSSQGRTRWRSVELRFRWLFSVMAFAYRLRSFRNYSHFYTYEPLSSHSMP